MWACPLMLGDEARSSRWAGVNAEGRMIAMRDSSPGHPDYLEYVTFEAHAVVVHHDDQVMVRTELDDDGRPLRSRYPLGRAEDEHTATTASVA
jgi:hypothetical protein